MAEIAERLHCVVNKDFCYFRDFCETNKKGSAADFCLWCSVLFVLVIW